MRWSAAIIISGIRSCSAIASSTSRTSRTGPWRPCPSAPPPGSCACGTGGSAGPRPSGTPIWTAWSTTAGSSSCPGCQVHEPRLPRARPHPGPPPAGLGSAVRDAPVAGGDLRGSRPLPRHLLPGGQLAAPSARRSGSGKQGNGYVYHGAIKEVYAYVLAPRFRHWIGCHPQAVLPLSPSSTLARERGGPAHDPTTRRVGARPRPGHDADRTPRWPDSPTNWCGSTPSSTPVSAASSTGAWASRTCPGS